MSSYTPPKIRGGGEQFKFQWTFYSKLAQFPFKWNMRNVPFFRFYVGTIAALFPFFAYVQEKVVYHPDNVENWRKIRESKKHTFFDLPHD